DLLVAGRAVRDKTPRRALGGVQAAVGADTQRACARGVLFEYRDALLHVRLVDSVARRIGEEDIAVPVHGRADRGRVCVADLLPRLVAINQGVNGTAWTSAAAGRRYGGWRRRRRRRNDIAPRHQLREDP